MNKNTNIHIYTKTDTDIGVLEYPGHSRRQSLPELASTRFHSHLGYGLYFREWEARKRRPLGVIIIIIYLRSPWTLR